MGSAVLKELRGGPDASERQINRCENLVDASATSHPTTCPRLTTRGVFHLGQQGVCVFYSGCLASLAVLPAWIYCIYCPHVYIYPATRVFLLVKGWAATHLNHYSWLCRLAPLLGVTTCIFITAPPWGRWPPFPSYFTSFIL